MKHKNSSLSVHSSIVLGVQMPHRTPSDYATGCDPV